MKCKPNNLPVRGKWKSCGPNRDGDGKPLCPKQGTASFKHVCQLRREESAASLRGVRRCAHLGLSKAREEGHRGSARRRGEGGPGGDRGVGRGGGRGGQALAPGSSAAWTKAAPADPACGDTAVQCSRGGMGRPAGCPVATEGPRPPRSAAGAVRASDRPDGAGRSSTTVSTSLVIRPPVPINFNLNNKEKRSELF